MKITTIISLLISFNLNIFSQGDLILKLTPMVGNQIHNLNSVVNSQTGLKFSVSDFNYYLSNITLYSENGESFLISDSVFLVKNNDYTLNLGNISLQNIEKITFGIGVPENLNTENGADAIDISEYPENHPLSFQEPSMYWGWSSGYMHMIISGLADSNADNVPDKLFEIHSLGNNNYRFTTTYVKDELIENQRILNLFCNIDTWLGEIDLQTVGIKHGEFGINAMILKNPTTLPVFTSNYSYLNVEKNNQVNQKLFKFEENDLINIQWENIVNINKIELVNSNGQNIAEKNVNEIDGKVNFKNLKDGVYFFNCYDANGEIIKQLKFIK